MPTIIGVVRRVRDREESCKFYEILGLNINTHSHGGPVHSEIGPSSREFVVEAYKQSERFTGDALMVEIENLKSTLLKLLRAGITPWVVLEEDKIVYVKDPDGADVMLIQSK